MNVKYSTNAVNIARNMVHLLHREALAQQLTLRRQGKIVGLESHALTTRYRRGDMRLSEFLALSDALGVNATDLIREAVDRQEQKMPSGTTDGYEN